MISSQLQQFLTPSQSLIFFAILDLFARASLPEFFFAFTLEQQSLPLRNPYFAIPHLFAETAIFCMLASSQFLNSLQLLISSQEPISSQSLISSQEQLFAILYFFAALNLFDIFYLFARIALLHLFARPFSPANLHRVCQLCSSRDMSLTG